MADISKIKLPNGSEYDLKDVSTRHVATYSNKNGNNTGKYYKISINSYTSWMLLFKICVYHEYEAYEYAVSGYNYGASHWYSPAVTMVSSSYTRTIDFSFGYDSNWHLWVSFPAKQYTGLSVSLEANGFYQVDDEKNLFTIEMVDGLPETVQTTKSCARPWYRNETIPSATNSTNSTYSDNLKHKTNLTASTIDDFHPAELSYANVSSLSNVGLNGSDGIVIWIPYNANYGRQLIFDDTGKAILSRAYNNGTWSSWVNITADASTSQVGVVKLNTATNSTSTTEAATPSAVKTAYDLANQANGTANTALSGLNGSYIYDHTFSITNGVATFTPHVYLKGAEVTSTFDASCFVWKYRLIDGSEVTLTTKSDRGCDVTITSMGYGGHVIGAFTPPA